MTTANDSGLWYGAPGALNLIAREGDAVPTLNATFNAMSNIRANVLGQLVFTSTMLSSDAALNAKTALMAYDPVGGLFPIIYTGEQIEVAGRLQNRFWLLAHCQQQQRRSQSCI